MMAPARAALQVPAALALPVAVTPAAATVEATQPTEIRRGGLRISSEIDPELGGRIAVAKPAIAYSDEQNVIIHCPSKIIVANAFAGTGKTTTAVGFAAARPNSRFLYLAFNKGIQTEAEGRFGSNTTSRTTHSLAYGAVGRHYSTRLSRPWRALVLKNELGIKSIREAAITQSILNKFFQSDDKEISLKHGFGCDEQFRAQEHEIHECLNNAQKAWLRMLDRSDHLSIPDDAYLKMWALTNPRLPYDHIIFDEAQDSNPVTAQIVRAQKHANILYIGDRHQSIYGFRGASNAMDDFAENAKQLYLSQTWRFGPKIAHAANLLLGELKGEKQPISGMGQDLPYVKGSCITKLARTNAQLFKDAAQRMGEGIHWIGGSKNYQLGRLLEAYYLYAGKRDRITDPFIRHFSSWGEMQGYAEEAKDPETRVLAEVIDEFRKETPELVDKIKANEVMDAKDASLILTTAHKSKGLDWDYVQIADDFEVLAETEADLALDSYSPINEQEINLLYVAITRAKKRVQLNEETHVWMDKLPEHRIARENAKRKVTERLARTHRVDL